MDCTAARTRRHSAGRGEFQSSVWGRIARMRRLRLDVLVGAALLFASLMPAATAAAARSHIFGRSFGEAGSGAGQMELRATAEPAGEKIAGSGIAVNSTDHLIYVADTENHRVDEFEADGTFVRAWGWGVGGGVAFEVCSAICQAGLAGAEPGEFTAPAFIAVDNSGGPSEGDVYVGDTADNVITKFSAAGTLESGWGTAGQSNGTGSEPFGPLAGLAVDSVGSLQVVNAAGGGESHSHLFTFAQDGSFSNEVVIPRGTFPGGLGVDGTSAFFKVNGNQTVEKFAASGEDVGEVKRREQALPAEIVTAGLAVDGSSGDLYVNGSGVVERYAFNASGEVIGASATCKVEPEVGCEPTETFGASNLAVGSEAGVGVDSSTASVYVGDAAADSVDVFPLEPVAAPLVPLLSVSEVTDSSALLAAELNPRSLPGEEPTSFQFEYGRCLGGLSTCSGSGYEASTASGTLPPGYDIETVSARVEGLRAGAIYHFRIVASNAHGRTEAEHAFTTRAAGEFQLLDGRRWEMVSPPAMHGAVIEPLGKGGFSAGATTQAATDGGALTYQTNVPTEPQPAGNASAVQVLSRRDAAGWSSVDVVVPHAVATDAGELLEVRLFSEDLSLAAVKPGGSFIPLSDSASEQTTYLRDSHSGSYTPLVTGCPVEPEPCPPAVKEHADIAPGTIFGTRTVNGESCPPKLLECGAEFVGASPDLKHVVLTARSPLKPKANPDALYEWNAGLPASLQLQLVSLLPAGSPAPTPKLGLAATSDPAPNQRGAVSMDGSRVFFTAASHLYMRDMTAEETVQIDALEVGCGECGAGRQEPEFQFASSDGSRIFFIDTQKLTADGAAYPSNRLGSKSQGGDLYECEIREDVCTLADLTPNGAVLGEVLGASEDGSWVYFVANGILAPGSAAGGCRNGQPGEEPPVAGTTCDLYADHLEGGAWHPRAVATLSALDANSWSLYLEGLVSRVSPNGNWLAFMSERPLTGYDNRDAISGRRDQEVYLYEAANARLTCASCDPTGARPQGVEYGAFGNDVPLLGNAEWTPETWLAGSVPAWVRYKDKEALYQPRYLSDSGRLFFDSHDALVSKDVNNTGDVYEFEPAGVPSGAQACNSGSTSGARVYKPARVFEVEGEGREEAAGCVGLISSGSSSEESALLDASASGGDVYFISTASLSPLDKEGGLTAYDAHECTVASPCIAPPPSPEVPCSTEASCKASPSPQPPIFAPSGSATFNGPGNFAPQQPRRKTPVETRAEKLKKALKACHKLRTRSKRRHCARAVRRRYRTAVGTRRDGTNQGVTR